MDVPNRDEFELTRNWFGLVVIHPDVEPARGPTVHDAGCVTFAFVLRTELLTPSASILSRP